MDRFSPVWWARTLGLGAFAVVALLGYNQGDYITSVVERACWAMLWAAVAGLLLGNALKTAIEALGEDGGGSAQVDAELPGTMPPMSEQ